MSFSEIPNVENEIGSRTHVFRLSDIEEWADKVIHIDSANGDHYFCEKMDDSLLHFALYEFCYSDCDDGNVMVSRIFHGHGVHGLREIRHTYFGDGDGYIFYLPMDAIQQALEHLKKWFD